MDGEVTKYVASELSADEYEQACLEWDRHVLRARRWWRLGRVFDYLVAPFRIVMKKAFRLTVWSFVNGLALFFYIIPCVVLVLVAGYSWIVTVIACPFWAILSVPRQLVWWRYRYLSDRFPPDPKNMINEQ